MPYAALLHSHVSTWAIGLLLFIIAYILMSVGKNKGFKITHMVVRLFYILIIVTGFSLLVTLNFPISHVIKGLLALWLIGVMEMMLVRGAKGALSKQSKQLYWIQWVGLIIVIFLIGYRVIG